MSKERKSDNYWESKVEKFYIKSEATRRCSQVDAKVISALKRNMQKSTKEHTEDEAYYSKKRAKLLAAQKMVMTPSANKSRFLASLVPDEVIYNPNDYKNRKYTVALMFVDVSGFTELCENYTTKVEDGTSAMTQILNSYIGSMVQEIVMREGDLLKFSGDAFLAMWKTSPSMSLMQAVQTAIDCGLSIQRDCGTVETGVGVVLRVKVALSAGNATFSIIGDQRNSHWVTVGQPVWDVKLAEKVSKAGDLIVSQSAWMYMNANKYIVKRTQDEMHMKIIGISATWRNVILRNIREETQEVKFVQNKSSPTMRNKDFYAQSVDKIIQLYTDTTIKSYRPSLSYAMNKNLQNDLSKFILRLIIKTIEADEPPEILTEMRYVIILFLNIVTHIKDDDHLISIVEEAYNIVIRTLTDYQGLLDKLTLFDKDLVCLAVFGLQGYKHELNVQQALSCAAQLKKKISAINYVNTVSIGVTAGFIYCGIVGHNMRRESTVIGMCVNKGARLMMAYPNKITCDKEVYLQSQSPSSYFIQMPFKELKGFSNVGPIYEYSEEGKGADVMSISHTALIGRDNELKQFHQWLQTILLEVSRLPTTSRTHTENMKNLLLIEGEIRIGKTRFVQEIMKYLPKEYPINKISVDVNKIKPYSAIKSLLMIVLHHAFPQVEQLETKIQYLMNENTFRSQQWCVLNPILGTNFSETSNSSLLSNTNKSIDDGIMTICEKLFTSLHFLIFDRTIELDPASLRLICMILDRTPVVVIMVVHTQKLMNNEFFMKEMKKPHTQVIHMDGIDRWHHATIICQLMKVDAISSELEKIVQYSSEGYVSWIEKFIRIMVHSKQLHIVEMSKKEVLSMGAIISLEDETRTSMIRRVSVDTSDANQWLSGWEIFRSSYRSTDPLSRRSTIVQKMKVAILNPTYNFEDMQLEVASYVLFLKTYDDMDMFEKLVLKCSSAMGEVFHTNLLLQVLRSENEVSIIKAMIKLFDLRIFEFTNKEYVHHKTNICYKHQFLFECDDSMRSSSEYIDIKNVYVRFRDSMFFKYAYDLLTQHQKKHYHIAAISILKNSIRKCDVCGNTEFNIILGNKSRNMIDDNPEERENLVRYFQNGGFHFKYFRENGMLPEVSFDSDVSASRGFEEIRLSKYLSEDIDALIDLKYFSHCKCEVILSAMYSQIIRHCKKSEKLQTLIDAYMEFADLKIIYSDVNEAEVIINEAEEFINSPKFKLPDNSPKIILWQKNYIEGRIISKKGKIMHEFGNFAEAEKYFNEALDLFEYPFPKNRHAFAWKYKCEQFKLKKLLKKKITMDLGKPPGITEIMFNYVTETLAYLFDFFMIIAKYKKAHLTAMWCFNTVMKANTDYHLLCIASANMITSARLREKWDLCSRIEDISMLMCTKRLKNMDIKDVFYYIQLITSILSYRLIKSDTVVAIKIGQKLLDVLSYMKVDYKLIYAMASLGEMLTARKMFKELTAFYTEMKTVLDIQDFSCSTFYYAGVVDVLLDTGYPLESYDVCHRFYLDNKDHISSSKDIDSGWYLIIGLSLHAVRGMQWDLIEEWDLIFDKFIDEYIEVCKYPMTLLRFLETQLSYLVLEIRRNNVPKCRKINRYIDIIMKKMIMVSKYNISYRAGLLWLQAYYYHIHGNNEEAMKCLDKGVILSRELDFIFLVDVCKSLMKEFGKAKAANAIYMFKGLNYFGEITKQKRSVIFSKIDV